MQLHTTKENTSCTIALSGRLDTVTAPALEQEIRQNIEGTTLLVLDFADLAYVSSAGLRVLLSAQKQMRKQGSMEVHHVNAVILEVLTMTGFVDILTIV